jgi:hypothetical protein
LLNGENDCDDAGGVLRGEGNNFDHRVVGIVEGLRGSHAVRPSVERRCND